MALAYTVTLLEDHSGSSAPRVSGTEYHVDALVDVTSVVAAGSVIPASAFGLSQITAAVITGSDSANTVNPQIECSLTGAYESASSIALMFTSLDGTNATVADDGNGGSVRVRVYGLI